MQDRPSPLARRRILIVSNLFPPHVIGGAEVVAHRQARQLLARGHQVTVFAGYTSATQAGRLDIENEDGLRIWRTPVASFEPDDNFFVSAIAARLQAVLEAEQPEIVHFHNLNGLGFSLVPLAKRRGLITVVTLHDHSGYCYRATALRPNDRLCTNAEHCALVCRGSVEPREVGLALPMRLRRDYVAWALAHADRLITPSAALADAYHDAGAAEAGQLQVISNGIDLVPFRPHNNRATGQALRFACIAYLGEHKGIPDLLQAASMLAADSSLTGRWSLSIAGDGHLRPRLESEIAAGRFGNAVSYLGRVPREQIIAELAATDVVVLPSRWPENEPVALLEAIAAGVAQLGTNLGGIPSLVQAGITGELIPPANPRALADAMAAYVREPDRAHRQGEANFARREQFAEAATIDAIEALYEAVPSSARAWHLQRPLVLCAGDWPLLQVAETANNLYRVEQPCPGARLVWHEWADPDAWGDAALFWNWSSGAHHAAIARALRCGLPVLAPSTCVPVAGVEHSFGAAVTYDSYLEGMLALARLPHDKATLRAMRRHSREAGALLSASAPAGRYHLPTPTLAA